MGTFHYISNSSLSRNAQWSQYLQQQSLTDDIVLSNQRSAMEITGAIGKMGGEISDAIYESADQVARAVNASADMLAGKIEDLRATFDWRMSQVIGQLELANMLAIIPDFQKERRYFIERGIEFSKKGLRNPDLFEDALNNFLEAEKREDSDYAVLYRIGLIYLYQPKLLDLEKAEDYLLRAGKYASAEADTKAIKAGADAYFQAGIACYAQGKYAEAAELSQRAFELNPSLLEAGFNQAKFLAADNCVDQALPVLRSVIMTERMYAPKTAQDGDLVSQPEVPQLLLQPRDEAVSKATEIVKLCKREMILDSQAIPVLREIEQLIMKNNYLDALKALDELTKKREWYGNWLLQVRDVQELRTLKGHSFLVHSVCFSPDGSMLASGSWDKTVKLWRVSNGKEMKTIKGHSSYVSSVCFSPDGSMLASGSNDGTVKQWGQSLLLSIEDFIQHEKQILKEIEAEKKRLAEEQERQVREEKQRQETISNLMKQAYIAESEQDQKGFFSRLFSGRDYSEAIRLYEQAASLGSEKARAIADELKARK